jgi:hypothetical protein
MDIAVGFFLEFVSVLHGAEGVVLAGCTKGFPVA